LARGVAEVRIFSRDERKQYEMAQKYRSNSQVKFFIGDIRDKDSVDKAMNGVDYVFHAAAMKQIPSCELYPLEAIKTNVLGSYNILSSAIAHKVKKVIFLSTDKAVNPSSMMGLTKASMEKIVL
jgi:UDP-glucose 4-epimerase